MKEYEWIDPFEAENRLARIEEVLANKLKIYEEMRRELTMRSHGRPNRQDTFLVEASCAVREVQNVIKNSGV